MNPEPYSELVSVARKHNRCSIICYKLFFKAASHDPIIVPLKVPDIPEFLSSLPFVYELARASGAIDIAPPPEPFYLDRA